jgi:hypothetical protein
MIDPNGLRHARGLDDAFMERRDEAIPPPGNRLDESRVLRGIAEGNPQFPNGGVQTFIKTHIGVG